jgi:hypothetical protein
MTPRIDCVTRTDCAAAPVAQSEYTATPAASQRWKWILMALMIDGAYRYIKF